MADRRQIEARIKKKEAEIQELEQQAKEARIYVQALQDVLKMFPKDAPDSDPQASLRPGSLVAQAREAILKKGEPMHVDEILSAIGKEVNRENKTALGGSLSAYVREDKYFTRPAPNTFGLKELAVQEPPPPDVPPPDFGQIVNDDDDIPF